MASVKPYIVLLLGTISVIASLLKAFGIVQAEWVWVLAPLWLPMAFAYCAFVFTLVHALGTGELTVVAKKLPPEAETTDAKIDLNKPKGPVAPPAAAS